jgi:hypothetical protein
MTVDPRHLDIARWSALASESLLRIGPGSGATDDEHWREWGAKLRQLPQLGGVNVPDPRQFTDWQSWAFAYNFAVAPLGL